MYRWNFSPVSHMTSSPIRSAAQKELLSRSKSKLRLAHGIILAIGLMNAYDLLKARGFHEQWHIQEEPKSNWVLLNLFRLRWYGKGAFIPWELQRLSYFSFYRIYRVIWFLFIPQEWINVPMSKPMSAANPTSKASSAQQVNEWAISCHFYPTSDQTIMKSGTMKLLGIIPA